MKKEEIKKTIKGYVAAGLYYPIENGEYAGGNYVDRIIDENGVNVALAAIIGIDKEKAEKLIANGEEPIGLSANLNGDEESIEIFVDYGEVSGYYSLNDFAEKFGE